MSSGSDIKQPLSLRESFGKSLVAVAKNFEFVVLDGDVAGGTCTKGFAEKYPERFIQCGVAEQNMVGVAAGLAWSGITPFVATYAVFASMRALEQVRNSIAYPNLPVKIAGSHAGVDGGPDGATHQSIEDLAIYRSLPNFVVLSPCDETDMLGAVIAALEFDGPIYIRTGRNPAPQVLPDDHKFVIGRADVLKEGADVGICATGIMVHRAVEAANILEKRYGVSARVMNFSTLKPIDAHAIVETAIKTGTIVVCQDHNAIGGLSEAVAFTLCRYYPAPIEVVAIPDVFGRSGEPDELAERYGLSSQNIVQAALRAVDKKRRCEVEVERESRAHNGL